MAKNYRHFLYAGLSGLLLALAYPGWRIDLGWLAWIGLIPLFWALSQFAQKSDRFSVRIAFMIGFATGLVYFLIVFRWTWAIYPLDTLGIQSRAISFLIILFIYLISSAGMAVFWGLFGIVVSYQLSVVKKRMAGLNSENQGGFKLKTVNWKLITIPAIFVLLEYARSWGFGFLWAGSGSLFGPHWTLGNLAYALADNPLALKLASYVGIYGITFLIVLANIFLVVIFTRSCKNYHVKVGGRIVAVLLPTALVLTVILLIYVGILPKVFGYKKIAGNAKKINFAIVQTVRQTNLSPSPQETLAGFQKQLELLNQISREYPESQLIVFPEASDFFKNLSLFLTSAQVQNYFSKLFKEPLLIISGGRTLDMATGKAYSRAFSLDTQEGIVGFYDKRLLTPNGEFLSYPVKLLTYIFAKNNYLAFNNTRDLNPGQKEVSTVDFRQQFSIAPLICSELISANITSEATQNSDIIVSMASYGIFHGNNIIANQMLAITRFRAAENNKLIITAANMGRSHVINSQGSVVLLAPNAEARILTGAVDIPQGKSWYNKIGDLPIILAFLLLMTVSTLLAWFKESGRP